MNANIKEQLVMMETNNCNLNVVDHLCWSMQIVANCMAACSCMHIRFSLIMSYLFGWSFSSNYYN